MRSRGRLRDPARQRLPIEPAAQGRRAQRPLNGRRGRRWITTRTASPRGCGGNQSQRLAVGSAKEDVDNSRADIERLRYPAQRRVRTACL